jgi:hypothetical protein
MRIFVKRMEDLHSLRKSGLISEAEFQAKRAEIFESL